MPKLQNRFRVIFGFPNATIITGNVVSATRPTISFDPVILEVYNSRVHIPGKHTWSTVDIVIRDTVDSSTVKAIDAQISRQIDMATQSVKRAASAFKFTTNIQVLDGSNGAASGGGVSALTGASSILDQWVLHGAYIENVAYGSNDYATSDPILITVTLKYDTAQHFANGNETDDALSTGFVQTDEINSTGAGAAIAE